jgi:hypothetical protein
VQRAERLRTYGALGIIWRVDGLNHQDIAVSTYNACWGLLEKESRTPDEDRELLTLAFASSYHWSFVGGQEQAIISSWMISRAAAAVGDGALAINFAQHAYDLAHDAAVPDWLIASVHEGLARACAAIGKGRARDEWYAAAIELADRIENQEYRALIADHLDSVPQSHQ